MAETDNVSENSKEILAPDDGPRENLVSTAVKFLQNPKTQNSPLSQRRAFLEKKGLTTEEIELAIERSGISINSDHSISNTNPSQQQIIPVNQQFQPVQYYQTQPLTGWQKVRSYTTSALIIATIAYTGYHLYRTYIKPLLFRQQETDQRLKSLEARIQEIQSETQESMKQIQESLKSIQHVITQQQIANSSPSTVKQHDLNNINDIKTEIQSLKGLLLNRRQFPPTPSTSPMLPSWQLTPSSSTTSLKDDNKNSDSKTREESDNTEVVTLNCDKTETVSVKSDILTNDDQNTQVKNVDSIQNGAMETSEG